MPHLSVTPYLRQIILAIAFMSTAVPAFAETKVRNVGPQQAARALAAQPNIIVLDVRTPREFRAGHIKGAINVDYYSKRFRANLSKLNRNATYLLHCRRGVRSGRTLPIMKKLGFRNIIHLSGGFDSWKRAKQHVARP